MKFQFKPVDIAHRSLVHHWLTLPHVTKWFYGQGLQNTFDHLDAFLNGATTAQYWLAFDAGHPFAFLITSTIDKPKDELSQWCSTDGAAITLDMLIGDTHYMGKGLAPAIIKEFLASQFPHVSEVLIDPEATNTRAIHVYQKAGFKILGEFIPSHSPHPHLMMRLNMNKTIEFAMELFKLILNQKVRNIKQGHGSFLTMGFGNDIEYEMIIRKRREIQIWPEWYFWIYMCEWEIEREDAILAHCEDDRETIEKALKQIEGKKLLKIEILNETYDMKLEFEGGIILSLFSDNSEKDNTQWLLYTPDRHVLKAGPNEKLYYELASKRSASD